MLRTMKKYIIRILLFFLLVAVLDVIFGFACQYMNDHSKGGGIKSRYYVCKESKDDILVFGSSRAKHHYVPDVIENALGMTCYNVGEDGNGIIMSYGFLKMITQRYSPKLIIYDVTGYDMYQDDNVKYLDMIKPFYYEPGIDTLFWTVEPKTRIMMISNLYRYNTTCIRVIGNFFHPIGSYPKGYCPLHKTMNYEPDVKEKKGGRIDSLKLSFFESFILLTQQKGIDLICCVSPSYKPQTDESYYEPVKQLCDQYSIVFINDCDDTDISDNRSYFQDVTHMNDVGARMFTTKLTQLINNIICF